MPQPLPDQLWRESLQKLELQMTRATFETWLKDTRVIPAANNGDLVIGVQSEYAKKWLEDKLMETVSRTVTGIVGRPVRIEFVVREEPIGAESAPALEDEETGERDAGDPVEISGAGAPGHEELAFVQDTNFHQVKTDMGRWLPELQYDSLFWNAYLGDQTWLFYRHLLMHWTKDLRKKDMPRLKMANEKNHWSSVFRLSYRKAVQWLGKSNQKIVPGGIYECHKSDAAHRVLKQDLDRCCQAHAVHNWQPKGEGGRCYYWRAGLLHRLYDEGLLAIEISGSGRARVQVWRNLPLLTPQQVGTMNSFLQDQHERWLEDNGRFYDLTVDQWLKFETPSLVPYLSYHKAGRQLTGRPPENPLLSKTSEGAS
jgi:hypothetical protein